MIDSLKDVEGVENYLFGEDGKGGKIDELIKKCSDGQGFGNLSTLISTLTNENLKDIGEKQ